MPLGDMIDDPTNNDEYVAQLLASEAKDKSLKYSALGLQAYLPRRPTDRAPKPNTRFLKNILRDTDTHNAALRRKEEEDARERMCKLRGERSPPRRERRHQDRSPSRRDKERSSRREHIDDSSREHHKSRSERHRRRHEGDGSESDRDRETSSRSHRRHRDEERRSRRSRRESSRSRHRSSRYSRDKRSASPRRSRSESLGSSRRHRHNDKDYERRKRDDRPAEDDTAQLESRKDAYSSDNESDPLEDLVGPLPREKASGIPIRGRGSYRQNTSTIDAHFERDYNPKLDVDLSDNDETSKRSSRRPVAGLMTKDEDEDWNMALEALRDRANWRQKGEERLRTAGFDESTVRRWKEDPAFANGSSNNDAAGRVEDVKWAKKGEGREWDRGKVLNEHGHYDVKGQW
ncbi:hypothetical protein TMatcc_009613 [Talaromyces marneffei ATCC 18224]|uniref:Pre-mRNA-splicing factor 38B n=2 Tax=Talaromyces marneffei TaxID=37727 RepID=B6QSU3_TALMQ|nr:conserved hypothetical protein [Talaromyces marneffei ATCC 18224]KAE8547796.1 hypothetical protein EYB25_009589 [Talaromyces marneffei]